MLGRGYSQEIKIRTKKSILESEDQKIMWNAGTAWQGDDGI